MSRTDTDHATPQLWSLARKEIAHYARHPLFLAGAALLALTIGLQTDEPYSTSLEGIAPAATLGLFGLIVMVSLTRNSDRAVEAAGAVGADQRTRTLAHAIAVVVPLAGALVWFGISAARFADRPPAPAAVPFGPVEDSYVYAVMFAQGVMASVGGPILGLVLARWVPRRGVAPVAVVVLVLVTILMQGLFEVTRSWREVWPWTHFYGPIGVEGDPDRAIVMPGSPYWYIAYQTTLCALGVLVALLRDDESERRRLARATGVVGVLAVVLLAVTITGGFEQTLVNPVATRGRG